MKNYLVREEEAHLGLFKAKTPGQAAFLAASAHVDRINNRAVEFIVSDGELRTTVKLEPKISYQVVEVSDPFPIAST